MHLHLRSPIQASACTRRNGQHQQSWAHLQNGGSCCMLMSSGSSAHQRRSANVSRGHRRTPASAAGGCACRSQAYWGTDMQRPSIPVYCPGIIGLHRQCCSTADVCQHPGWPCGLGAALWQLLVCICQPCGLQNSTDEEQLVGCLSTHVYSPHQLRGVLKEWTHRRCMATAVHHRPSSSHQSVAHLSVC